MRKREADATALQERKSVAYYLREFSNATTDVVFLSVDCSFSVIGRSWFEMREDHDHLVALDLIDDPSPPIPSFLKIRNRHNNPSSINSRLGANCGPAPHWSSTSSPGWKYSANGFGGM